MSTRTLVLLCGVALLAGCAQPLSVEEAKKLTTTFAATPLVAPPRTIADITAILDQQKRQRPEQLDEAKARATLEPPPGADAATLAIFYADRGHAAAVAGNTQQEIEDLTRSVESLAKAPTVSVNQRIRIIERLSLAEYNGGRLSRAVAHQQQAIDLALQQPRPGWLMSLYRRRALWQANRGDRDGADRTFQELVAVHGRSLQWRISPELRASHDVDFAWAEGDNFLRRGKPRDAIAAWRRAQRLLGGNPRLAQGESVETLSQNIAQVLAREGRLLEAEIEARKALLGTLRKQGRESVWTARRVVGLALVVFAQGRYTDAEALARASLSIHEGLGSDEEGIELASASRILIDALIAQRRWTDALAEYDRARRRAQDEPVLATFAQDPNLSLAFIRAGRPAEAIRRLRASIDTIERRLGQEAAAYLHGLLGMAYAAAGDRARARDELRAAVPVVVRDLGRAEDVNAYGFRAQRAGEILRAYVGVLVGVQGPPPDAGAVAEAFWVADAARGRAVARALDASAARGAATTPELADLVRREQDATKQVQALQAQLANLLAAAPENEDPKLADALRAQIKTLDDGRRVIGDAIARRFPAYAQLTNPSAATVPQVQAALRPGEAMIATYVTDDRTYVWAVPKSGPVTFAAAPLGEAALRTAVNHLREALDPQAVTIGEIPAFDVAAAHDLYRALLEPVRGGWERAATLITVPHGPLALLPFGLLPTRPTAATDDTAPRFSRYRRVPWLIRSHAVTVLPSAGTLATLRSTPAGARTRRAFAGFGDPYFSRAQAEEAASARPVAALATRALTLARRDLKVKPGDSALLSLLPRLPDTADEIRGIAAALNADLERDVFLGVRANEHTVKTLDLASYRVIAFATHGLLPGELDGLTQPALALTAPDVANVEGDGLLTTEKILALRLDADWVVLSACNTASGDGAGAEAVSGLGRAFFYAGVRALLVSQWPVETTSARALTTDVFRRQRADPTLTRAKALQQTMNWLIDDGVATDPDTKQIGFSYAHPIYWAPFMLVGDGGGAE